MVEEIVRFVVFLIGGLAILWLAKSAVREGVEEALSGRDDGLLHNSYEFKCAVRDAVIEALKARSLGQDGSSNDR